MFFAALPYLIEYDPEFDTNTPQANQLLFRQAEIERTLAELRADRKARKRDTSTAHALSRLIPGLNRD